MTTEDLQARIASAKDELAALEATLPKLATRAQAESNLNRAGEDCGPFYGAVDAHAQAHTRAGALRQDIEAFEFALARRQLLDDKAKIESLQAHADALQVELDSLIDAAPAEVRRHAVQSNKAPREILQKAPSPDREERYAAVKAEIVNNGNAILVPRHRVALIISAHPALAKLA